MATPHKHCELIKAWADGAVIEFKQKDEWFVTEPPEWNPLFEYRIKPENTIVQGVIDLVPGKCRFRPCEHWEKENIELEFDGESGRLVRATVLKGTHWQP